MPDHAAFWIDSEHDRDSASDGKSRYGHYLRDRREWFEDCAEYGEPQTARFAATAWRIATGPIMSPGYARYHPRVLRHDIERNEWDGSLVAAVDLITGWPEPLDRSREWRNGKFWQEWPAEYRFASDQRVYLEPSGEDLTKHPYLMASASLRFAVPMVRLPVPPVHTMFTADQLLEDAKEAVAVLVAELNRVISPVIETLEGP